MVKFIIEYGKNIKQYPLKYIDNEYSFYTGRLIYQVDWEVVINNITLDVNNSYVVDIGGYCSYLAWTVTNKNVPKYKSGVLKVVIDFDCETAYRINDTELPVYVNTKTGWVCIGDKDFIGQAVEFIDNCVAVINDNGEFMALWLKPLSLPKL